MKGGRNKETPDQGESGSSGAGRTRTDGVRSTVERCRSCGDGGNVEIEAVQRNCECQMMRKGCENNEKDSDSDTRVRDLSATFFHLTEQRG